MRRRAQHMMASFWFIPAMCVLVAIVSAETLVAVDHWLRAHEPAWWASSALAFGVDGSRGLLTAIGGGTFGAAATAFSITISVIVTASTSYGPRLVGNFMADRRNQLTLGILVSTFVYTILVSRWLRSGSDDGNTFVPRLAVLVALMLGVVNVVLLISFLHHMAASTRVSAMTDAAVRRLGTVIETELRRHADTDCDATRPVGGHVVLAERGGYVGAVDLDTLVSRARDEHVWVVLEAAIGDRIYPGGVIARISHASQAGADAVRAALDLDSSRQSDADVHRAMGDVIEVAVRALSPGTNDPATAVNAIDELASALVELVRTPLLHGAIREEDGAVHVFWRPPSHKELIDAPFLQLDPYLSADHTIYGALVQMAWQTEGANQHPELAGHAREHATRLMRDAKSKLNDRQFQALTAIDERARELYSLVEESRAQDAPQDSQ